MKKEIVMVLVITLLASTIVGTMLLTVYFGNFFELSSSFSNFSRILTFKTHDSSAVVIGSHLFVISNYPEYLSIESTDWDYSNCNISLDERDKINGRIYSAAVAERIFVWGIGDEMNLSNLTFLLLDPWNCSYKALPNLVFSIPNIPPEIVVSQDFLDVFFPNQSEECSPCRFDDNGDEIELQHQIETESVIPINSTHIKTFNNGSNYAYTFNLGANMSVLTILDQDFNILNQINTSFQINELAVTSNSADVSIGILGQLQYLAVFDFSLQLVFTAQLPRPHAYEIASAQLSMDSRGNSFVTSVLLGDTEKYHLLRYNATGHLNYEIELDEYRRDGNFFTQSFLIDDGEYCLVNHCKTNKTYVKCVSV